jgi:hypothetical protein
MMVGLRSLPVTIEHAQWTGTGIYTPGGNTPSPQLMYAAGESLTGRTWKTAGFQVPGGSVPFRLFEVSVKYTLTGHAYAGTSVTATGEQFGGAPYVELRASIPPSNIGATLTPAAVAGFRLVGRYVAGDRIPESAALQPGEFVFCLAYCPGLSGGATDKVFGLAHVCASLERQA